MSATTQHEIETQRNEASTMRAIVQDTYGTTDNWQLADTATPEIGADEVLVRVRAAAGPGTR